MIPSRRGIERMINSLARSLERRPISMGTEPLPVRAGILFGLDQAPAQSTDMVWACDAQQHKNLVSEIESHWNGERLVFETSGSTGMPQKCVQEMGWLIQEGRFLSRLFQSAQRVVGLVPVHHIYGFLFTVLLPEFLDVPVLDLDAISLGSLSELLQPGDVVIGFPLLWKKAGEVGVHFPPRVTGVTSTGPCPPKVIARVLENRLDHMVEIHGSTETGGIGYRLSPDAPYKLMDHWHSFLKDGRLARHHPSGGDLVRFLLPDELDFEGERVYRPVGRKDNAVQIAGMNVYPHRIRQVLLQHPLVADAAVRPMNPAEGDRLKAFIVISSSTSSWRTILKELRDYLAKMLSPPEIPRSFTFGSAIPRNDLGKETDWEEIK